MSKIIGHLLYVQCRLFRRDMTFEKLYLDLALITEFQWDTNNTTGFVAYTLV